MIREALNLKDSLQGTGGDMSNEHSPTSTYISTIITVQNVSIVF